MGPQTKSAIRSFQQKNGLVVDGVVGQGTINALMAALSANGALPPASSTVIAKTNLPVLGSFDFRARAIKLLEPLPPYPQEITSNGQQRNLFTQMTGLTQEMLRDTWAKGKNLTSCNAFTGWFSRAMGSKKYLGRFDLDKAASRSWVPASSGRTPRYGDILRFKTFHVGIELDLVDGILHTAEGGQAGRSRGFDAIKRKQMTWDSGKFLGWVDLEGWIRNNNALSTTEKNEYEIEYETEGITSSMHLLDSLSRLEYERENFDSPPSKIKPLPPSYQRMTAVSPVVQGKTGEIVKNPKKYPMGTQVSLSIEGKNYLFAVEWHKHKPSENVRPELKRWHRGVTVYKAIVSIQFFRFLNATSSGDWKQAFLNLNGLNSNLSQNKLS